MKMMHLLQEPNLSVKFKPFPYQRDAFEAIKDLEYAAVFHEQGLGKTKIAIDLALYWLENTDIDTIIIATKKQLVFNWINEFAAHTYIKPGTISDNKRDNYIVFTGPARVIITHFETLQSEFERYRLFLKSRNVAIIIDESTKFKNPEANITKTAFALAPLFKRRVIMTGTPVANRPYDIWAQIYFLDFGKSLGSDYKSFKKNTDLSNDLVEDVRKQESFESAVADIFKRVRQFSVRETKNSGVITLPKKEIITENTTFDMKQKELYNCVRNELCIEILKDGVLIQDDSSAIVKRLIRLIQITSNPRLVDDSYTETSAKELLLEKVIEKILGNNEKCIVWTNFIENVNYLNKIYAKYGSVKIHGGISIDDRNKAVIRFKDEAVRIMFATPASAKEGLTLTSANHVIFYDRGFSLDDYLQAQDRIHRISQQKNCYVHNLVVRDSIDEWIDVLLTAKQNAAALAQGDIAETEYKKIADYSFGDIVKNILFGGEAII